MNELDRTIVECERCKQYGMLFRRRYSPADYFEGDPKSRVWIVGINPAGELGHNDDRTREQLRLYFDNPKEVHPYFKDFRGVSKRIKEGLEKDGGVGHTDIIKCYSKKFPPDGKTRSGHTIMQNCTPYFLEQLKRYHPKMIICNGIKACNAITQAIPETPGRSFDTHYFGEVDGSSVVVVLSGFIGRIDNFSRRRLGLEIERLLDSDEINVDV